MKDSKNTSTLNSKPLSKWQKLFYGFGHLSNDLWINVWFSYLIVFTTKIIKLSETDAGLLILVGQIADAVTTVLLGQISDRIKIGFYGKRKLFHLIGTILGVVSFPLVFNKCIHCEEASQSTNMIYYTVFSLLCTSAFSTVQLSHLALIPEIAKTTSNMVQLNSIR